MATAMVWARSCGGDAGGDAFARLDGDGEGGLVAGAVVGGHQAEAELLDALAGQGEADQAAGVTGHEIDGLGRGELGGDDEVAFILPVFVIDEDEHAAVARVLDQFLDGGEVLRQLDGADVVHGECLAGGVGDSNCRGRGSGPCVDDAERRHPGDDAISADCGASDCCSRRRMRSWAPDLPG